MLPLTSLTDNERGALGLFSVALILVGAGLSFRWAYRPPEAFYPSWLLAMEAAAQFRRPIPGCFDRAVLFIGYLALSVGLGVFGVAIVFALALFARP